MWMAEVSPSGESIVMSTISSILLLCACTKQRTVSLRYVWHRAEDLVQGQHMIDPALTSQQLPLHWLPENVKWACQVPRSTQNADLWLIVLEDH